MEKPNGKKAIDLRTKKNQAIVEKMFYEGYSVRQIMRHMKWKSPGSVQNYLRKLNPENKRSQK